VVHSLGRKEYGRLGLGKDNLEEKSKPTVVPKLRSKKCVHVCCGTAVSYAVANDGAYYFVCDTFSLNFIDWHLILSTLNSFV